MKKKIEDVKNNTFVVDENDRLYILFEKDNREQDGLVLSISSTIEKTGISYGKEVQIPNKIEVKCVVDTEIINYEYIQDMNDDLLYC